MTLGVDPLLALALAACGRESPSPQRVEAGRLGRVELLQPNGVPLLSDKSGWSAEWERAARRLCADGAAIDLPIYLQPARERRRLPLPNLGNRGSEQARPARSRQQ